MLYILGGAPRAGKSILSRRFVVEKQIPYFPVDALITVLQEGVPELGIKHGQPFVPKAEKMWKTMKPLLLNLVEEAPEYLIEGDGLLPKFMPEITKKYKNRIKVCFVGYTNITPEKKLKDIRKFGGQMDDWTKNYSDTEILEFISTMVKFSHYLKKECKKHGIKYFDLSEDFQEGLDKVFNYLTSN